MPSADHCPAEAESRSQPLELSLGQRLAGYVKTVFICAVILEITLFYSAALLLLVLLTKSVGSILASLVLHLVRLATRSTPAPDFPDIYVERVAAVRNLCAGMMVGVIASTYSPDFVIYEDDDFRIYRF